MSVEPAAIHTTLRQQILTKKDMANTLLFRKLQGTSDINVCISILIQRYVSFPSLRYVNMVSIHIQHIKKFEVKRFFLHILGY